MEQKGDERGRSELESRVTGLYSLKNRVCGGRGREGAAGMKGGSRKEKKGQERKNTRTETQGPKNSIKTSNTIIIRVPGRK